MQALIDVYRMNEVCFNTRIKLLRKLGQAINDQYASNITDELVKELTQDLRNRREKVEKQRIHAEGLLDSVIGKGRPTPRPATDFEVRRGMLLVYIGGSASPNLTIGKRYRVIGNAYGEKSNQIFSVKNDIGKYTRSKARWFTN